MICSEAGQSRDPAGACPQPAVAAHLGRIPHNTFGRVLLGCLLSPLDKKTPEFPFTWIKTAEKVPEKTSNSEVEFTFPLSTSQTTKNCGAGEDF